MLSLIPAHKPRRLLSLSLLLMICCHAGAQTADDFFHSGAQSYLTNNVAGALEVVTNGLQRFPDDEKLQKLYELLNQKQQQQQQNQKEQEQKDQQKQDQSSKDNQSQKDKDKDSKEDQKKPDNQEKDSGQKGSEEKNDPKPKKDSTQGKPQDQKEAGQPETANLRQMSAEEAKQLLDSQKGDEQVLMFQPQGEPKNRTKQLKDW